MKLKTLKDIEWETNWKDDVKKEAVKWVKTKLISKEILHKEVGEWIIHFFNLTEEDLK